MEIKRIAGIKQLVKFEAGLDNLKGGLTGIGRL